MPDRTQTGFARDFFGGDNNRRRPAGRRRFSSDTRPSGLTFATADNGSGNGQSEECQGTAGAGFRNRGRRNVGRTQRGKRSHQASSYEQSNLHRLNWSLVHWQFVVGRAPAMQSQPLVPSLCQSLRWLWPTSPPASVSSNPRPHVRTTRELASSSSSEVRQTLPRDGSLKASRKSR